MRDILKNFPDIQGYVLLTEGFWYKQWGGGHGASKEYVQDWARNWCRAVAIVAEECHAVNPAIEVLPWEYNIDFRPQNTEMKRYFIQQLPADSIPLLTWENGKSFEIENMQGYLRDYSLNQVGPAEVTEAQIAEARQRNMKVYSKADAFASWQYGTIPYLPFPNQWYERYKALEKYGVNGTLESWSSGYTPNLMTHLRAWTCWTDAPPFEELLGATAERCFGTGNREQVLKAWDLFSQAIRLVLDTGPNFGTNNAIGNPLFLQEPPLRTMTFKYSGRTLTMERLFGQPNQSLLALHRHPHGLLSRFHEQGQPCRAIRAGNNRRGSRTRVNCCRSFSTTGRTSGTDGSEVETVPLAAWKVRNTNARRPSGSGDRRATPADDAERLRRLEFEDLRLHMEQEQDPQKPGNAGPHGGHPARRNRTHGTGAARRLPGFRLGFNANRTTYTPPTPQGKTGVDAHKRWRNSCLNGATNRYLQPSVSFRKAFREQDIQTFAICGNCFL